VAEIVAQLVSREQLFGEHRLDSIDAMRAAHSQGRLPELAVADVFLVIDNWGAFKDDFEDLAEEILQIGTRGLGYGVHLMITAGRFADFRLPVQAVIGTKLELRLNDPLDSVIDRKAVANLRADTPGRVVTEGGLTAQLALARIDGAVEADTAPDGLDHLVGKTAAAWPGPPVAPIRMLPTLITRSSLHQDNPGQAPILLGLNETELGPVRLDLFRTDPHLLVFGEAESGKTNLARLIVAELTAVGSADEVVFAAFDLRRTLLDVIPERYLGAYAGTLPTAAGAASGVASELRKRLPPDDVTTSQLRERSWWSGPEIVVLVDDYDLLAPAGPGPLAPLLEFLPQARDVGLHLVVLRRSGGASRAVHEPVLQRMRELGATGLLLSGERQEGQLWPGAYLSAQPPGRGLLVRRGQLPRRIQLAYEPESLSAPAIG
jgi:S-DNA-T family DNA segregation ATPase FtsK/SpoIIIE